jgi:hypothetical protein
MVEMLEGSTAYDQTRLDVEHCGFASGGCKRGAV